MPRSVLAKVERAWHMANGKFKNNYLPPFKFEFSKLQEAFSSEKPPEITFPLANNDVSKLQNNTTQTSVSWIGHCTMFLQNNGINIITDPVFSHKASPVAFFGPKRTTPPGIALEDLPPIDLVLISHSHYDHLDYDSIMELKKHSPNAQYLVPLKLKKWFNRAGIENVTELDWWEETKYNDVTLTAVPTQHWTNRSMFDINKSLWCGWVYESNNFKFIFIGDTGYSPDFKDIQAKFTEFDLAIIPIGAYFPRSVMKEQHQNPAEAVQCMVDLNTKLAVATHWGTFLITYEPMDEPPKLLQEALVAKNLPAEQFLAMQHGETKYL